MSRSTSAPERISTHVHGTRLGSSDRKGCFTVAGSILINQSPGNHGGAGPVRPARRLSPAQSRPPCFARPETLPTQPASACSPRPLHLARPSPTPARRCSPAPPLLSPRRLSRWHGWRSEAGARPSSSDVLPGRPNSGCSVRLAALALLSCRQGRLCFCLLLGVASASVCLLPPLLVLLSSSASASAVAGGRLCFCLPDRRPWFPPEPPPAAAGIVNWKEQLCKLIGKNRRT
ncbi:hypothetical protein ZWY2020_008221 [Hordeum vulgare]|nr:hypothetical protein ZWY2020_008221 [Hordeum vulgare]